MPKKKFNLKKASIVNAIRDFNIAWPIAFIITRIIILIVKMKKKKTGVSNQPATP